MLQKAELRFRSLLEAAPDAMVICREDGIIELVNSRTETLFLQNRDELLGRNIRQLVPAWEFDASEFNLDDFERFGITGYERRPGICRCPERWNSFPGGDQHQPGTV